MKINKRLIAVVSILCSFILADEGNDSVYVSGIVEDGRFELTGAIEDSKLCSFVTEMKNKQYSFEAIPLIILFDPNGCIACYNLRGQEIINTVERALKQ